MRAMTITITRRCRICAGWIIPVVVMVHRTTAVAPILVDQSGVCPFDAGIAALNNDISPGNPNILQTSSALI